MASTKRMIIAAEIRCFVFLLCMLNIIVPISALLFAHN